MLTVWFPRKSLPIHQRVFYGLVPLSMEFSFCIHVYKPALNLAFETQTPVPQYFRWSTLRGYWYFLEPWISKHCILVCIFRKSQTFPSLFRVPYNFLCILKTKMFPGTTFCNKFALLYLEIIVTDNFFFNWRIFEMAFWAGKVFRAFEKWAPVAFCWQLPCWKVYHVLTS